jgi:hypothetical protein
MKAYCRYSYIWHLLKNQIQTKLSIQCSNEQPLFIADPVVSKFVFPCPRMTTRAAWDYISNINPLSPIRNNNQSAILPTSELKIRRPLQSTS